MYFVLPANSISTITIADDCDERLVRLKSAGPLVERGRTPLAETMNFRADDRRAFNGPFCELRDKLWTWTRILLVQSGRSSASHATGEAMSALSLTFCRVIQRNGAPCLLANRWGQATSEDLQALGVLMVGMIRV